MTTWTLRRSLECETCKTERRRRCRVILPGNANDGEHMKEPFAHAPYVHPFNAPKYHAQQLRAVNYAKATNKRVLWIVARDWPIATGDENLAGETLERARGRWLLQHDKSTAGIMGLLPLVHDMPMRLTTTEDAKAGAFKNARAELVGWKLTDAEATRVAALDDPEIVLEERPIHLLLKLSTATETLPDTFGKGVFVLKPKVRVWTRDTEDQAKVKRIGFSVVPEFGGTIHGYCGDTLDASLNDLLPWHRRPTIIDMQKAYISKSRVRKAEHMLLVQPYSPELFRMGELPGPKLLMEVLRRNMSAEEAKTAWKKVERETQKTKEKTSDKWPLSMPLPCRKCTDDNGGEEVRKPLKHFSNSGGADLGALWTKVLAQGQDLDCLRCTQLIYKDHRVRLMVCDDCQKVCLCAHFGKEAQRIWREGEQGRVVCTRCEEGRGKEKRENIQLVGCQFCSDSCVKAGRWPHIAYEEEKLLTWRAQEQMNLAQCAACVVRLEYPAKAEEKVFCNTCEKRKPFCGPPQGFSPVLLRQWLDGIKSVLRWSCYECQYPVCQLCRQRPDFPAPHNSKDAKGRFTCEGCRHPPCAGCGKARPTQSQYSVHKMPIWRCGDCGKQEKEAEQEEKRKKEAEEAAARKEAKEKKRKHAEEERRLTCSVCEFEKAAAEFSQRSQGRAKTCCQDCEALACEVCGGPCSSKPEAIKQRKEQPGRRLLCDECRYPKCASCGREERLRKAWKYSVEQMPKWYCHKARCRKEETKNKKRAGKKE